MVLTAVLVSGLLDAQTVDSTSTNVELSVVESAWLEWCQATACASNDTALWNIRDFVKGETPAARYRDNTAAHARVGCSISHGLVVESDSTLTDRILRCQTSNSFGTHARKGPALLPIIRGSTRPS